MSATSVLVSAPWRAIGASVTGSAHATAGGGCEDAHRLTTFVAPRGLVHVACVADGAGCAAMAAAGAALACDLALDQVRRFLATGGDVRGIDHATALRWYRAIAASLRAEAASLAIEAADLASTLLLAVLADERAFFAQIGDGAIALGSAGALELACWPQHGEFCNATSFVISDTMPEELVSRSVPPPDAVALLTDGLEPVALSLVERTAHRPFFAHLWRGLAELPLEGMTEGACQLGRWLASDALDARTDDDRTLVLLTRRPPAPLPRTDAPASAVEAAP